MQSLTSPWIYESGYQYDSTCSENAAYNEGLKWMSNSASARSSILSKTGSNGNVCVINS